MVKDCSSTLLFIPCIISHKSVLPVTSSKYTHPRRLGVQGEREREIALGLTLSTID